MAQGTLSVTNNSTAVAGVGTTFTDYAPGSFITLSLVGVPYTIAVDTVTDDTHLVLLVPFDGPTTSDAAFEVTGVNTMALATMGVTTQAQRALRMLLTDQANWRQIFSMEPSITITLPSGQQLTGMSWGYISQQLAGVNIDEIIAARDATYQARDDAQVAQAAAESAQTAQAAAESAQTAASASAATATGEANRAQEAAAASAAAASAASAAAAGSIEISNLLAKDQNLDDLPDKSAARGHLDVYSKYETYGKAEVYLKTETYSQTEVDAKNTATNARIGYSLLTVTNPALNSRTVITNPFGNNVPVICSAEFFHATLQKWVNTTWIFTTGGKSYGFTASNSEGEGVILRVGSMAYSSSTVNSGNNQELTANYTTLSPVRIHVWKVTA